MFNQIKAVFFKELLDARRDLKSLITALFMPVLFSAMMLGSIVFITHIQDTSHTFSVAIKGHQYAAPLVAFFEEADVSVQPFQGDPKKAIEDKRVDMVLVIPPDFPDKFNQQNVAEFSLFSNHSNTQAQVKARRIKGLIQQWSFTLGSLRMMTRNVDPAILQPVVINDIDTANPQRAAAKLLGGLPLILILIAFVSGIGTSADMAAGEKERKSLEPLLINPITHLRLFIGKWLAGVTVTFAISVFGVGLQFGAIHFAPIAELGLRISLNLGDFFAIFFVLIPLMFMAVALQLLVSFYSKSFKDAQSYNSLVMLLPMAPGIFLIFNTPPLSIGLSAVPLLGPQLIVMSILGNETVTAAHFLVSGLVSCAVAALLAVLCVSHLRKESTLFS